MRILQATPIIKIQVKAVKIPMRMEIIHIQWQ